KMRKGSIDHLDRTARNARDIYELKSIVAIDIAAITVDPRPPGHELELLWNDEVTALQLLAEIKQALASGKESGRGDTGTAQRTRVKNGIVPRPGNAQSLDVVDVSEKHIVRHAEAVPLERLKDFVAK